MRLGLALVIDRADSEARRLCLDAADDLGRRERRAALARGRPRGLFGESGPAAGESGALQIVELVVRGEYHRRQRYDYRGRQAQDAENVVQAEPHALDVVAVAQSEQIAH